jgi:hypothetical protein
MAGRVIVPAQQFTPSRRQFLQAGGATGRAAPVLSVAAGRSQAPSTHANPSNVIVVGSQRQLLFDDFLVGARNNLHESIPYGIHWSLGKVRKSPERNFFEIKEPWHDSTAWYNVLYDDGRYRMWYCAGKAGERGLFVCYAESDDGVTWRKPVMNLIEKGGSRQNNVVYTGGPGSWRVEMGNVFRDPSALPEQRYKMIYPTWLGEAGEEGATLGDYSSEGLHWTRMRFSSVAIATCRMSRLTIRSSGNMSPMCGGTSRLTAR